MFRGVHSYIKILAACVIPFISACVVIPYGSEVDQQQILEFYPGTTHRSEVIEQIGEPNISSGDGFDVYHLEEGQFALLVIVPLLPVAEGTGAEEIYNLVFHYDANSLLKDLRYEKSLDPNDPDLILLDTDFTGKVKDFTADGEFDRAYISADGRLITAISETNIVIQAVEGESREIDLEQTNFASLGYGRDCAIELHNHHRKKQNPDFNWLSGIQDIRPLYKLCKLDSRFFHVGFEETADGSGLALANAKQLEFLSQTGDVISAPEADQSYINGIWFGGLDDYVVTSSVETEIFFLKEATITTELKIRSLPSLNTIASIRRPFSVRATAMSGDHRFFALVSDSHVELWRRKKELGESSGSGGHYELSRVLPIKHASLISGNSNFHPPRRCDYYTPCNFRGGYLRFSPEGEYLMWVDILTGYNGQLYLWDMDGGRPVAEIVHLDGILEAAFNHNNEIVIVSSQQSNKWLNKETSNFHSLKIWQLPLDTVKGN